MGTFSAFGIQPEFHNLLRIVNMSRTDIRRKQRDPNYFLGAFKPFLKISVNTFLTFWIFSTDRGRRLFRKTLELKGSFIRCTF